MSTRSIQSRPNGIMSRGVDVQRALAELGGTSYENGGANTANSQAKTVTNGTANVKGTYQQLIASTAADAYGIIVTLSGVSSANMYAVDISTGAAGSEVVVIPDIMFKETNGNLTGTWYFPVFIPAGTAISARSQGVNAATINVGVTIIEGPSQMVPREQLAVTAMGLTTSAATNPKSCAVTGTNSKSGGYTQIISSTAFDFRALVIGLNFGGTSVVGHFLIDFATGAAGSETILVPNLHYQVDSSSNEITAVHFIPCDIPAGTRLAAQGQCSVAAKPFGISVYGVR